MDSIGIISTTQNSLDSYQYFLVINGEVDPLLIEDLQGIEVARWFVQQTHRNFEDANLGGKIYGPLGSFEGLIHQNLPNFWKKNEDKNLWFPDSKHPLGKWLANTIERLISLPEPEILADILKRYGIEGSKDLLPTYQAIDNDFVLAISSPKKKTFEVKGVVKDSSLRRHWFKPVSQEV